MCRFPVPVRFIVGQPVKRLAQYQAEYSYGEGIVLRYEPYMTYTSVIFNKVPYPNMYLYTHTLTPAHV